MNMVLRGCMLWKGQGLFRFFGRQRVGTRRDQKIEISLEIYQDTTSK